jgi:hypothetical protein
MAVIATVFGILGRFAGKVLTMSLGWASTLLFGRVPRDRQVFLAAITFGAVIWAVLVVGVLVPDVGSLLLAFMPIPPWVEEDWVRLGMLAGAIALPLVLGGATLLLVQPEDRPTGIGQVAVQLVRGYPLAAGLSLMLVFLAVIGIGRKVSSLLRRRTDAHIPIVLKPGGYEGLVDDLEAAIDEAGVKVTEADAPAVLVVPGRVLATVAGAHVRSLLPDRLVQLKGEDVEVLIGRRDLRHGGDRHPGPGGGRQPADNGRGLDDDEPRRPADRRPAGPPGESGAGRADADEGPRRGRSAPREPRHPVRRVGGPVPGAPPGRA